MSRIIRKRIEEQWLEVDDNEGFEEADDQADAEDAPGADPEPDEHWPLRQTANDGNKG